MKKLNLLDDKLESKNLCVSPHTKVWGLHGFLDAQRALQPKGWSYKKHVDI